MDSFLSSLSGRLPNIPRNGLGRQIKNGAALEAAIEAYNALPPCGNPGPVPCNIAGTLLNPDGTPVQVDPKLKFGDDFNSFDMRITRTFHFKEPHSLQAIAEVFNLFNITNIRGYPHDSRLESYSQHFVNGCPPGAFGTDLSPLRPNASSMIARKRANNSGAGGSKSCIS